MDTTTGDIRAAVFTSGGKGDRPALLRPLDPDPS
jgi:hypothetical protein